jgi:hypothetical protein
MRSTIAGRVIAAVLMAGTVIAAALVAGAGGVGWAARPGPPETATAALPAGWSRAAELLTWNSGRRVPTGDAAVEFFDGERLLGRPAAAPGRHTFTLRLDVATTLADPQVRAAGRRLDAGAPPVRGRADGAALPALLPPNAVDPGRKGPYRTITGGYTLAGVRLPGLPHRVEMQAVVVAPRGTTGRRPLALFLHGRHDSCYRGRDRDQLSDSWPCGRRHRPVPSYRGYLQSQRLLAEQGYVTVSIAANGIGAQDADLPDFGAQARSSLVRLHLAHWAAWAGRQRGNAPAIVRSAPRADMSRVFLIGHSRGGEGVSRAAMDSLSPPPAGQDGYHGKVRWTIRGVLLLAPTDYGQNPAPDVPSVTVLPGCDGDVADLQGQLFVDATRGVGAGKALHSSLYLIGANHNFFNTEWTPGQSAAPSVDDVDEDYGDPVCARGATTRLTARQQQTAEATYIAAAARVLVFGDDRVRPLLDGTGVRAPSADPARVLSHALGAGRIPVIVPGPGVRVTGGRICAQVSRDPGTACLYPRDLADRSPHFAGFGEVRPEAGRYAVGLAWAAAGSSITVRPPLPVEPAASTALAMRLIVPPDTGGTRIGVSVADAHGRRVHLGDVTLRGLPGSDNAAAYWGQEVRVPLRAFPGRVAKVVLTSRGGAGRAWLLDAWGWRAGLPAAATTALPRLDLGEIKAAEDDAGVQAYRIPVTVTGTGYGRVRLFLLGTGVHPSRPIAWVATVRPGLRSVLVRVPVHGSAGPGRRLLPRLRYELDAKAVHHTVVGDYRGGVEVTDDDGY